MKKYFIILSLVCSLFFVSSQADKHANSQNQPTWYAIDQLLGDNLPESALKKINKLKSELGMKADRQELIKIKLYEFRIRLEKDPDEATKVLEEFEEFVNQLENSAEKQLMWVNLAELYVNYYQSNIHIINQRSELMGEIPTDMNVWTANHFKIKINELLNRAWENINHSQNTDIRNLKTLFEIRDSTDIQTPTLFDFLAYRKISILSDIQENEAVIDTYQEWIHFRKEQKDDLLSILTELKLIDFEHGPENSDEYLSKLDSLENLYHDKATVVEIWAKKANFYLANNEIDLNRKKAYDIAQEGISKYPDYKRINLLKNIISDIETQSVSIKNNHATKPNRPLLVELETTNVDELTIEVYQIHTTAKDFIHQQLNKHVQGIDNQEKKSLISKENIKIAKSENFDKVKTEHFIKASSYGIYKYVVYPSNQQAEQKASTAYFSLTDFSYMKRAVSPNQSVCYILDRVSGKPISNVEIEVYEQEWKHNQYTLKLIDQAKTNAKGYAELKKNNSYSSEIIMLKKGNDAYFTSQNYAYYYTNNETNNAQLTHINLFTDRSIYRPGQIVQFKAIAYQADKQTEKILAQYKVQVELIDANGQTIQSKELITNEFGSVSGEFTLPNDGLNGNYQIRANNKYYSYFSVEAYKRPSFEVLIKKPEGEFSFGETINIKGETKAFSGYSLPDLPIKYTVKRYVHPYLRWIMPVKDGDIVASGISQTNEKGEFEIKFIPQKLKKIALPFYRQGYQYIIEVEATDSKGESQAGSTYFYVSEQSLFIRTNLPDLIERNEVQNLSIHVENISGKKIDKAVKYHIFSLNDTDDYLENQSNDSIYTVNQLVIEATHHTQDGDIRLNFEKHTPGRYKLLIQTEDQQGRTVTHEQIFIVYNKKSKRPPIKTYAWSMHTNSDIAVGEKAVIQFGSSVKKAHVLMEVKYGNQLLSSKWMLLNNQIKTFKVLLKEEHKAGLTVSFTFIKDEKLIHRDFHIKEKKTEKKLSPSLKIFRDKLVPGENANWTIHIPELAKSGQQAELLVSMYDASLDVFRTHQWHFNPAYVLPFPRTNYWVSENNGKQYDTQTYQAKILKVSSLNYPYFNWYGFNLNTSHYHILTHQMRAKKMMAMGGVLESQEEMIFAEAAAPSMKELSTETADDSDLMPESISPELSSKTKIRSNFNETAFFYPQLLNDKNGDYQFSFSVPESLTRWNLMMLAHSKDLYFGQNKAEILTQQDLMVELNMPRFVRQSDKIQLKASLVNLSESDLQAAVFLQLINPKTNEIVLLNDTNAVQVELAKDGQPQSISWELTGFEAYDLLICKVVAQSGNFSDGEQHYLVILPDKVLVTESFPINIRGGKAQNINLDRIKNLGKDVQTQQLSLEFTANPIWYAIQAMPSLSDPNNENAVDYFTAWYVNTLAGKIIADNPIIQQIFEQIQLTDADTWQSALMKNQDLKNILIQETPWLTAAQNETERMQRMALLFDLNKQQYNRHQFWEKLVSLQLPNGAFSWFEGMQESRGITQFIVDGLAKAQAFSDEYDIQTVLEKAVQYLDGQLMKDYLHLKKSVKNFDKKMNVTHAQIQYLAVRSQLKSIAFVHDNQDAYQYYLSQLENYHSKLNLYDIALAAKALYFEDKTKTVNLIVQSLKENALQSDELGMYWAKNKAGYFMHERPILVQTQIMELFNLVDQNDKDLSAMKIWLLRQKQTQNWESPIASLHAIQALTGLGDNVLKQSSSYTISVGDQHFDTNKAVAGLAYIKEDLKNIDISQGLNIQSSTANPRESDIAWGAVYWQYYQEMDKIEASGHGLQIEKQYYIQQIVNNTKTLVPLNAQKVKIGDKIISRMVVSTDRDLEYVALQDKRSAALEPVNQLSGSVWRANLIYYRSSKDASTQYFFNYLPKGKYVFEDEYYVNSSGDFSGGTADIQCLYAPEFVGTSKGARLLIGD